MFGRDAHIPLVVNLLAVRVAVDVQLPAVELTRMDGDVGQDAILDFHRTNQRAEVFQVSGSRVHIVITHHQLLNAVQSRKILESIRSEQNIAKVPNRITLPNNLVPTSDQFLVVFLNGSERTVDLLEFQDLAVPEVSITDYEDSIHFPSDARRIWRE